jgi:hypothetical protein
VVTVTKLEKLKNRYWLHYDIEDGEPQFICNDDDINKAAELWKISPDAVRALADSLDNAIGYVVDMAIEDLKDVWSIADCAHQNAMNAMELLLGDDDCNEDIMPNAEDCKDCEWYGKEDNTCKQPPDAD